MSNSQSQSVCVEPLEPRQLLTDVLTYHNDNARTGQNLTETTLTTSNVDSSTFGKLYSFPTDGQVYAQPLYKTNVAVPGRGSLNLLFVATQHDSLYAFDTGSGSNIPVWHDSFINPAAGVTPVTSDDVSSTDIAPEIGITGTPVIDSSTNTLYVVTKTKEIVNGHTHFRQRLHAIDLSTGSEKFGGPVVITATVAGVGDGTDGVNVGFNSLTENQRPALLLSNGVVYITWASHGDNGPYHGWMLGYQAADLTQSPSVLNFAPDGSEAGVWMSGGGPAVDASGDIFLATGNGTFDANSGGRDYGDSALRITPNLSITDSFTPADQSTLNQTDQDLGSGGMLLLPDQPGATPHEAIVTGKEGTIYVLNRDNLGGFNSTDAVIQEIPGALPGAFDTPAYFNGSVYYLGSDYNGDDVLKQFTLDNNGLLSTSPVSSAAVTYGFPGATPSISANGSSNGIVWTLDNGANGKGPAILHADDASDVSQELYNSEQAGKRDEAGLAVKFSVPTIADGKVFVGGGGSVTVYGLLGGPASLTATATRPGSISLQWSSVAGATSYKVYRSTTPGGEGSTPVASNLTHTSFTDTSRTAGKTYYYTVAAVTSGGTTPQSNEVATTISTPFGKKLIAAPAIIEAENFDNGGEGVGYHDLDSLNPGEVYRSGGVAIERTTDYARGYDITTTRAGEWLNYTFITTAKRGTYILLPRVASNGAGGTFHIEIDGTDRTGRITVPNTHGGQSWKTLIGPRLHLSAGKHLMRLVFDSAGSNGTVGNFNWIGLGGIDGTASSINRRPAVSAGKRQTITLPATAALLGSASDDGLPAGVLTTRWTVASGPGAVRFAHAGALHTTASFSMAGTYLLRLRASDGELASTSEVTVVVRGR